MRRRKLFTSCDDGILPRRARSREEPDRSIMPIPEKTTPINRKKLRELSYREEHRFMIDHPRSGVMSKAAQDSLLGGVPMNWMKKWAGAFPIFVTRAKGAH